MRDLLRDRRAAAEHRPGGGGRRPRRRPATIAARLGGDAARARALRHGDGAHAAARVRPGHRPAARPTRSRARCRRWSPRRWPRTSRRRDFTVNAMAVGLRGRRPRPSLRPARRRGGPRSLGVIRVLHERSFLDDPTRLLRAVRFETRLGLPHGRGDRARGPRRGRRRRARHGLGRAHPRRAARPARRSPRRRRRSPRIGELGIDSGAASRPAARPASWWPRPPSARWPSRRIARSPRSRRSAPRRRRSSTSGSPGSSSTRASATSSRAAARTARPLAAELRSREHAPSELRALLAGEPRELLALALASGAPPEPILRWLSDLCARAPRDHRRRPARGRRARGPGARRGAGRRRSTAQARRGARRAARRSSRRRWPWRGRRLMPELALPGARVLFTDRNGGVSEGPYESLNLGVLTDDDPAARAREPAARWRPRSASSRNAWRWAGRCTAPTCAELARAARRSGLRPPGRGPAAGGRPRDRAARARAARPGGGLLPGRPLGRRARGDGPLRLARARRRHRRAGRGRAGGRRGGGGRARGSGPAATRWAPRSWRRSPTSRTRPDGRMLDLRAIVGHKLAAAGVTRRPARGTLHELPCRPLLLTPPRRRAHRAPGRARSAGCLTRR